MRYATTVKTNLVTATSKFLILTLIAGLFGGCAATRPISDAALGAGGVYLGHELSSRPYESRATASIASCVADSLIVENDFDCDNWRDASRNP